tara:strand:- start:2802 stop:2954 length:153 start_codon:yes stop_codon:yes gene_type:complete
MANGKQPSKVPMRVAGKLSWRINILSATTLSALEVSAFMMITPKLLMLCD